MKPILLIRHAEPALPTHAEASHWTDTELSPLGRRQAQAVAEYLKEELVGEPCALHSSDLKRAAQTAAAIADALGLDVALEPGLREFNNGLAVGGSEEQLRQSAVPGSLPESELLQNPQGESWSQFYDRVARSMQSIVDTRDPEKLLIITAHYGANMHAVSWWLAPGLTDPSATTVSFNHDLTGLTRLVENAQGKRTLDRLNDTSHLLLRQIPLHSR